jgi:hypothetical protein
LRMRLLVEDTLPDEDLPGSYTSFHFIFSRA